MIASSGQSATGNQAIFYVAPGSIAGTYSRRTIHVSTAAVPALISAAANPTGPAKPLFVKAAFDNALDDL
jgi:hypothetical protein